MPTYLILNFYLIKYAAIPAILNILSKGLKAVESKRWQMQWSKDLETGFNEIDNGHKSLINFANLIYDICSNFNNDFDMLAQIVEDTQQSFLSHFAVEETIFKEYDLSHYLEHKELHEKFELELIALRKGSFSIMIHAIMLNQIIMIYLIEHFYKEDKPMIEALKEKIKVQKET